MQETRPPAPLLCTYMGRQDTKSSRPFRFILNRSKATAANVYLMMYPKPELESELNRNIKLMEDIWQHLNQVSYETMIGEGRVYGGGLHKIEPKELGNVALSFLNMQTRLFDIASPPKQMMERFASMKRYPTSILCVTSVSVVPCGGYLPLEMC